MDIAINKKSQTIDVKRYLLMLGAIVLTVAVGSYVWSIGQADFTVDRETIVLDKVKRGKFTVSVRGTGVLVPENVRWLSANVEGTVVKRLIRAGHVVEKGDLIVELSNPQLIQQLAEAKWELEALEAEFEAAKIEDESAVQQQKSDVLNSKLDYERNQTEFEAHHRLIKTGAVSKLAYDRIRVAMDQSKQVWLSSVDQLKTMKENLRAQENARSARLNQTKKMVERIQQQVDDLNVKATLDGIVLEMPLEAGQRVAMGDNVAKLAQQDSLIAELQVPEIQIRNVTIGQQVVIDTRNSKIEGSVSRVDPAVVNGNVQVDVSFDEHLPDDARPDLSVDGEIKITEIEDALYVDRPLFTQSQRQSSIYRIIGNGRHAERTQVTFGYGSVSEIQVIEGLQEGDSIVTSDPTRFESYDKFRIN